MTAATFALFKGALTGSSPVDRARLGSKHSLLVDGRGIPLAVSLTAGNRNDVTQLLPLIDGVAPVRGKIGRPRQRADRLIADRGYDHDKFRRQLRARGVTPVIARRGTAHGSGLGTLRWVVERTFAWLHQFRRLRIRSERRPDLHEAFLSLACASSAGGSSRRSESGSKPDNTRRALLGNPPRTVDQRSRPSGVLLPRRH